MKKQKTVRSHRKYLIKLRKEKMYLTQQSCAEYLRISRTAYINIEFGKQKEIKLLTAISLAKLMNVDIQFIISEELKRINL